MKKQKSKSSTRPNPHSKRANRLPDTKQNLSDIPEAIGDQLRRARRTSRATVIGLGKFHCGTPDLGSNKSHLITFGLPANPPRVSSKTVAKLEA